MMIKKGSHKGVEVGVRTKYINSIMNATLGW